ncbi:MAG: hypothetical protein AAFR61_10640 [Bacteroidota bacterium]
MLLFSLALLLGGCDALYKTYGLKWPTKAKHKTHCENCQVSRDIRESFQLEIGEEIYLQTNAYQWLKKALGNARKDGLTVEFVLYEPYSCDYQGPELALPPGFRGEAQFLKGQILKPTYRKKLLKVWEQDKQAWEDARAERIRQLRLNMSNGDAAAVKNFDQLSSQKWQPREERIFLGKNPMPPGSRYAVNLLLIGKKRVCRIQHINTSCGERYQERVPLAYASRKGRGIVEFPPRTRQDTVFVPFQVGSATIPQSPLADAVRRMQLDSSNLFSVSIRAFASVEGDIDDNDCLAGKRAQRLKRKLAEYTPAQIGEGIPVYFETRWEKFYQQVYEKTGRRPRKSNEDWRQFINSNPEFRRTNEALLAEQRIAEIILEYEVPLTPSEEERYAFNQLVSLVDTLSKSEGPLVDLNLMKMALEHQAFLFHRYEQAEARQDRFIEMRYPVSPEFGDLILNQFAMQSQHFSGQRGSINALEQLATLKELMTQMPANALWVYNKLVYQIEHFSQLYGREPSLTPERLFAEIDSISGLLQDWPGLELDRLKLNYHYQMANSYFTDFESRMARKYSATQIYESVKDDSLTEARALKFAKLFVAAGAQKEAVQILEPFIQKYERSKYVSDESLYQYFLQIMYTHPEVSPGNNTPGFLLRAHRLLSPEAWCGVFKAPCGISFQALDQEKLKDLYCESCTHAFDYLEAASPRY